MTSISTKIIFLSFFFLTTTSYAIEWNGLFIAGDHSIDNFDNARMALTALITDDVEMETVQLTSQQKRFSKQDQVYPAIGNNVMAAFGRMQRETEKGCFVHMTSHGVKDQGFYMSLQGVMPPQYLAAAINEACADRPTVILVSACYSGQFITEKMKGPNRVILTAAHASRPSFGCSPDTTFTFWDACLLTEYSNSETWVDLYDNVSTCIEKKEGAAGFKPSLPQAFFGENTKEWPIFH